MHRTDVKLYSACEYELRFHCVSHIAKDVHKFDLRLVINWGSNECQAVVTDAANWTFFFLKDLILQFNIVCSAVTLVLCAIFQKNLQAYQFRNKQTVYKTYVKLNSSINVNSRPQSTKFQGKMFSSLVDEKNCIIFSLRPKYWSMKCIADSALLFWPFECLFEFFFP
jgi:hypothetical protein